MVLVPYYTVTWYQISYAGVLSCRDVVTSTSVEIVETPARAHTCTVSSCLGRRCHVRVVFAGPLRAVVGNDGLELLLGL